MYLKFVPDVVATCYYMCASTEKFLCQLICDSFSVRGILAVCDDKIYFVFVNKTSDEICYDPDSGVADYISDKKNI